MKKYVLAISQPVIVLLLALLALLAFAVPAHADGIIIPRPPVDHPPVSWRAIPLTVKYHRVEVTIKDQVALTYVDQVFVNEAGFAVEGTYVFPLPVDAAISSFDMTVDGQKLEGKLLDRDQARAIYEDIVRQQRDPALLEYVGRGAFQASIFPIPPGAERRVELTYSQVLVQSGGLLHYRYPLNTEKFSAHPLGDVAVTVSVEDKSPLRAIYAPGFPVSVTRNGGNKATISYEAKDVLPNQDFDLYYSLAQAGTPGAIAANLLSYKPFGSAPGDEGFFLLLVTPPLAAEETPVAKDVIMVLDTSGSMEGQKLEQAKEAARYVLEHLGAEDRFNIVSFSSAVHTFEAAPVPASRREAGSAFVDGLRAQGSTDINRALLEAGAGADPTRPTILIFLTDGQPTMGETDPDRIVANVTAGAPRSVRLFAFGVGYDVDTVLLDQLSSNLRGTSAYVKPGEAIDETVSGFYARVSSPVLVDVGLSLAGVTVEDVYPYPLPDLFAGEQLVLAGRYRPAEVGGQTAASQAATLKLTGSVNGRPQVYTYSDLAFASRGGDDFVARLWAQRKIGYLLAQIRLHAGQGGDNQNELVREVVALSTRYGIVTPYTSFLVQEPQMALSSVGRDQIAQDLQAPQSGPGQAGGPAGGPGATAAPGVAVPSLAGGARSGAGAVQRAEVEKQLQAGAYPAAPAPSAAGAPSGGTGANGPSTDSGPAVDIRQVGDKTFVLQAGAWLDTQFDTATMRPEPVIFGSERYFQLLSQHPEVGPYLALGERVTLVLDGKPYAIGPDGQSEALPGPTPAEQSGPGAELPSNGTPLAATAAATAAATVARAATVAPMHPGDATPAVNGSAQATPAQAAPGRTAEVPARVSVALSPCAGGLVVAGLAAWLPLWRRRNAQRV